MNQVLNAEYQRLVTNEFCHSASMTVENIRYALGSYTEPSVLYRPALFIDGDQWCALYGGDLQNGVAGFGKSPQEAMHAFDREWYKKLGESQS